MLVVMQAHAAEADVVRVEEVIRRLGFRSHRVPGPTRVAVCVTGNEGAVESGALAGLEGVRDVIRVSEPYKLVSREVRPEDTVIEIGDLRIGGDAPAPVIAGPCSVESEARTLAIARAVREAGATMFRAGAWKPRTSPYAFGGLEREGLETLATVRRETGLPTVTEVIEADLVHEIAEYVDVLQVGARNMQNFALLRRLGEIDRPVLLKRGPSATLPEWLLAAEYVVAAGNPRVILCERGVRTFVRHARNTLDLAVVPRVRELSHLPVIVDPSHGVGQRARVRPMARAALAGGAQGLLIETHCDPDLAYSDAAQTIDPATLAGIVRDRDRLRQLESIDPAPTGVVATA